jgi:uncharacterized protein YjbJ (UPF0337 family)
MSSRAAWRLESLGYSDVSDYAAGKVDWQANGLPTEGHAAREPRIGSLAVRDVPTCRLDQSIGQLQPQDDLCIVVNEQGVILGDLRGKALRADPATRVEDVMNPAPITYRPNVSLHEMAHYLVDNPARRVLVSDSEGHFLGVVHRDDVQRALTRGTDPAYTLGTGGSNPMGERFEEMKGKVKEGAGKMTGNEDMEAEGKAEHDMAKGKRETKGAANEMKGHVEEGLGKVTGDDEIRARGMADRIKGDSQRAG